MANSEHLAKLKKSITEWNAWRTANPKIVPDLIEANLSGANFIKADLSDTVKNGHRRPSAASSKAVREWS